jgi:two-component system KDP operon response regulator KdpE
VAVPTVNTSAAIRLDDVVIDLGRRVVLKAAREVRLSPTEFALLGSLARQAGVVVDHETLLREVWGGSHLHERNYLWTFVQRLRQKLEDDPASPRIIVRVGSRGYRLGGPLTA